MTEKEILMHLAQLELAYTATLLKKIEIGKKMDDLRQQLIELDKNKDRSQ